MSNFNLEAKSAAVLGWVIASLRKSKGLKQNELAAMVGVGPSVWSRIEKGDSGLSIEQLRQVASALGVSAGRILEMVEVAEDDLIKKGVGISTSEKSAKNCAQDDDAPTASKVGSVASGAAVGAMIGTVVPIVGTALGAIIGGSLANYFKVGK